MCKLQFRLPSGMFFGGWVAPGPWEEIRGHIYRLLLPVGQAFEKKKAFCVWRSGNLQTSSVDLLAHPT